MEFDEDKFFLKQKENDPYIDLNYPMIKQGAKFTPKIRGFEYSVFIILDARAINNHIKVGEIIYTWCTGYYSRLNKEPIEQEIDRDELLLTHNLSHQGKKIKV